MIRVVLADDHALVRRSIRGFLEGSGKIQVVAEVGTGDEALAHIRTQRPDVAVLDIQMPGRSGLEVTRAVRAEQLPVGILILTAHYNDPFVITTLQSGANGYISKAAEPERIIAAVQTVYEWQLARGLATARKALFHPFR